MASCTPSLFVSEECVCNFLLIAGHKMAQFITIGIGVWFAEDSYDIINWCITYFRFSSPLSTLKSL